ncbi:MAG TPA: hypothetical protein VKO63_07290 [Chitinispirillaceae bacterium]|nr:hypothetical protein [Chitinispirillaceae bacterium]
MLLLRLCILVFVLSIDSYGKFGERLDCGSIDANEINEASGIAASRLNAGILWVHNDSGDKNRIFALNTSGRLCGTVYLNGVEARDWEDIAVGPGPDSGVSYVYIAETGDNKARYDEKRIFRFREPLIDSSKSAIADTVSNVETIRFRYADGKRDAEALMVDPLTRDCYIVTKREMNVRVYKLPFPQDTMKTVTLKYLDTLDLSVIVAADISTDGTEIIMKNYHEVLYWKMKPKDTIKKTIKRKPLKLPYVKESQGEAVCFSADGSGYFTIGEKKKHEACHLYFYPRE